jgi:hypothetical protein
MLIIHILHLLLSMMLRPLAVVEIHALRLGQLVDFGASDADEEFLSELVGDGFTFSGRGVLVCYP